VGKKFIAGQMTGTDIINNSAVSWTIKNKYYRADIELLQIGESGNELEKLSSVEYQAIIIVIDGGSEEDKFKQIKPWLSLLSDGLEAQAVAVNHPSQGSLVRTEISESLREWAVKSFVEIIPIAHGSTRNPNNRVADDGVDRVCQMLECVMWPEMTRAPPGGHSSKSKASSTPVVEEETRKQVVKTAKPAPLPKSVTLPSTSKVANPIWNSKWDNLVDSDDDSEGDVMENKINNFQGALREIMDTRDKNKMDGVSWETKMNRAERTLVKVAKALEIEDDETKLLEKSCK